MPTKRELEYRLEQARNEISELKKQIESNIKRVETKLPRVAYGYYGHPEQYTETRVHHELTLAGKVDLIAQHLGIDFEVKQQETKTTGPTAKVVVKKKPTAKKKVTKK